jgi:hypothetical protein
MQNMTNKIIPSFPLFNTLGLVALFVIFTPVAIGASPAPTNATFEERRDWLFEQFAGQKLRGHPKTAVPDAVGRLAASNGQDAEALEYLSQRVAGDHDFFDYPWITYTLYRFGDKFSDEQLTRLRENIRKNARDLLGHGTENHAAMRIASGYLFAQYFPDVIWQARGRDMTSAELMEEAKKLLIERGQNYFRIGNNEQLSTAYAFLNVYPILALVDFAEDPEVRLAAEALVLYQCAVLAANNFDGHVLPPLNRNTEQMRFMPPEHRGFRYTPIHHTISWLLWDQNEVLPEDFRIAMEPPFAIMFGLSDWRMPEVIKAVAHGAGAPYELRSVLSSFGTWGRNTVPETLRYLWRHPEYAMGSPVAHRFNPAGFLIDHDFISIAWKSDNMHRALDVGHPYWRSNHGEDAWRETHSPFQQSAAHRNVILVMFEIPDADPWPDKGQRFWVQQRSEFADNLMKLGQVRFPVSVDEMVSEGDTYVFREGKVLIAVRVMSPGHTLETYEKLTRQKRPLDTYNVIKSRAAQTGFVIEVGTTDEYASLREFHRAVANNPLEVNWDTMTSRYRSTEGNLLEMRYDRTPYTKTEGNFWIRPEIRVNGEILDTGDWPVFDSPVVTLKDRVLTVSAEGQELVVDWSGELPVIQTR